MTCKIHDHHDHTHGAGCGHTAIKHGDHTDYLHDGHLHHEHNGHYDEHSLSVNETNPDGCHPVDTCKGHVHGEGCGHEAVTARRSHRLHRQRPPAPPTRRPLRRSRSGRDCEVSAIEAVSSEISVKNKRSSENAASVKNGMAFSETFCVFHLIGKEGGGEV